MEWKLWYIFTTGKELKKVTMKNFGEYISSLRMERELTLREFCKINNLDPSNWSKVERSKLPPLKSKESIVQIMKSLGIGEDSPECNQAIDLAMLGSIPDGLIENKELLNELPIFFRTVRGETLEDEDYDRLINFLKREV